MALMSYRQYAAHHGCSLGAVQKAIGNPDATGRRTGRIAAALVAIEGNQHPKIDSVKADALWALNTDESKRSTLFTPNAVASVVDGIVLTAPGAEPDEFETPTNDPEAEAAKKSYHQSRALRESINVEDAQLDLNLRKGKLIDLDDAKQLGFTTLRTLRDALRNTGPRIAAQVAALTDPYDCEQLINGEIDAVLSSITVDKILADQDDGDDQEGQGD
jgi:hypothetical protein